MTWSIYHEDTYDHTVSGGVSDLWEYHFETFLPTRGYTTTPDELGGIGGLGSDGQNYSTWGLERTFTFADGSTFDYKAIWYLRFPYGQVTAYDWDGTTGSGGGAVHVNDTGFYNFYVNQSGIRAKWLVSDEDTDAWLFMVEGEILGGSFGMSGLFFNLNSFDLLPMVVSNDAVHAGNTLAIYCGYAGGLSDTSYVMTNNFPISRNPNNSTYGFNQNSDLYLRINGSTSGNALYEADAPASVQLGGTYYLDLRPNEVTGVMLETGATDLGVLFP